MVAAVLRPDVEPVLNDGFHVVSHVRRGARVERRRRDGLRRSTLVALLDRHLPISAFVEFFGYRVRVILELLVAALVAVEGCSSRHYCSPISVQILTVIGN